MAIFAVAIIGTAVFCYMMGKFQRRVTREQLIQEGWDACVQAYRQWEASLEPEFDAVYAPPAYESVEAADEVVTGVLEDGPVTEVFALEPAIMTLDALDPPVVRMGSGGDAYHDLYRDLADYASGPQPAVAVPEGDEWTEDTFAFLREPVAATAPHTYSEVVTLIHDSQPMPAVEIPALPDVDDGWSEDLEASIKSWADEDWATTMPWERDSSALKVLIPA
jgi:hypothetical protein